MTIMSLFAGLNSLYLLNLPFLLVFHFYIAYLYFLVGLAMCSLKSRGCSFATKQLFRKTHPVPSVPVLKFSLKLKIFANVNG